MMYTTNYDRWLEEQIAKLRTSDYSNLDIDNLILELEALGRAEKSAVKSLVYQILLHMLLIDYWHEESKYSAEAKLQPLLGVGANAPHHWRAEIDAFQCRGFASDRRQAARRICAALEDRLTTNLIKLAQDNLPRLYAKARLNASRKSRLAEDRYPVECPYTIEDIIN